MSAHQIANQTDGKLPAWANRITIEPTTAKPTKGTANSISESGTAAGCACPVRHRFVSFRDVLTRGW